MCRSAPCGRYNYAVGCIEKRVGENRAFAEHFHKMIVIIHVMKTSAPTLLPLLRSNLQGEVTALLFLHPERQYTVSEIAVLTNASQATVSRELSRLENAGLLESRQVGKSRLVNALVHTPVGQALQQLMYVTYGPVPALREALAQVPRLEAAAIYGSWAKRRSGEPGQVPHDLDVLAIGTPSRHALYEAIDDVEQRLGLEINVKKLSRKGWNSDDPFVKTVRSRPIIPLFGDLGDNDA